jgi:hypothetical protein
VNDQDWGEDDDVVLNGRTLTQLNMKRGGENGIKFFLKDIVKSQMQQASQANGGKSVYNLVATLKAQMDMTEVENEDTHEDDTEAIDGQHNQDGAFKLVVDTEKAFQRALHFMIVWDQLDTSGDRMIGLAELEKLLPQSEASALMRSADVNKDGELTFSELASQIMQYVEL